MLLGNYLLPLLNSWLIVEMQLHKVFSIGNTLIDVHLNWLNWLYSNFDRLHVFSIVIPRCYFFTIIIIFCYFI